MKTINRWNRFCRECGSELKIEVRPSVTFTDLDNTYGICPNYDLLKLSQQRHDYLLLQQEKRKSKYDPYTGERL